MRCERGKRGAFETWVLRDDAADSLLELAPARGGLVTRARIGGVELLYLDDATFHDTGKNVRGGIPICFPIAGRLGAESVVFEGCTIRLPQHGFARNLSWDVVEEGDRLTIALESSDATRAGFPFEFELRVTYRIVGASVSIESQITNKDRVAMPAQIGFHPYFWVPAAAKAGAAIEAAATAAFDNKTGVRVAYSAPALGGEEVDLHLLDVRGGGVRLRAPGRPTLRVDYGGFPIVVIWTLPNREFVCVEPWSAPAGALANMPGAPAGALANMTGEWGLSIAPGARDCRMWFVQVE